MTTVAADVRVRDVAVGPYSIRLNETGDAGQPAILWLHGSGPGVSALSNWRALMTSMPGYHHVAPDVLGFGDSSHPQDAPHGTDAYTKLRAEVTLELLDELGVDGTHVVGNSMGGMIAVRLLQQAPQRFGRVILMGSGGAPGKPTEALMHMVGFYRDPTPAAMRSLLEEFIYDTSALSGDLDQISADRAAVANRPEVRRSHLQTFDLQAGPPTSFGAEELAAIDHEVLLIHGRDDRVIPLDSSVYFVRNLPHAQLHILPAAGHWVQIEQVERFRAQAQLFLGEGP